MDIDIPVEYIGPGSQVEFSTLKRAVRSPEKKEFPACRGRCSSLASISERNPWNRNASINAPTM